MQNEQIIASMSGWRAKRAHRPLGWVTLARSKEPQISGRLMVSTGCASPVGSKSRKFPRSLNSECCIRVILSAFLLRNGVSAPRAAVDKDARTMLNMRKRPDRRRCQRTNLRSGLFRLAPVSTEQAQRKERTPGPGIRWHSACRGALPPKLCSSGPAVAAGESSDATSEARARPTPEIWVAYLYATWQDFREAQKRKKRQILAGGRYRDRTCDPFHVKEVLFR